MRIARDVAATEPSTVHALRPPSSPVSATRQRGSAFAQFAILLASIGVIVLAVLQLVRR